MSIWLLDKVLKRLVKQGHLTVTDHRGRQYRYGTPSPGFPDIALRLADARVPLDMVRAPALGVAEAFMDGRLIVEQDDILGFIALVQKNTPWEHRSAIEAPSLLQRIRAK